MPPVELLHDALGRRTFARDQRDYEDGAAITVCGLVVTRQRPGTATGVIFLTLEDDTGVSNVIIWSTVFPKYRAEVMGGGCYAFMVSFSARGS